MSFSFPLDLPNSNFVKVEFQPISSVVTTRSPFSYASKSYDWGGKILQASVSLPPLTAAQAKEWIAFFLKLNGPEGTFKLGPTVDKAPSGTATGSPAVNGASQTGQSLITDGWTTGVTGILNAGDWFELESYLYRNLVTVNSDVSGNATLDIWPALRSSPANDAALTVTDPKGLFRMSEIPSQNWTVNRLMEGTNFSAIEAI